MNIAASHYFICVILTLGVPTMIATEAAHAQKAQGPKTATHSPTSLTAPEIARRTLPAVVIIECENANETSQGSGFLARPGVVVTNYHVIKDMVKGTIRVVGGQAKGSRIFRITDVLAIDERSDLALLGVLDAKRAGIPILPLAAGNAVIGETVYAFGNPEGLSGTMSPGIVSSALRVFKGRPLLQITEPISHGSSGGPVVDSRGLVVGIAVGSLIEGQNLNFAVPSSLITSLVRKWETGNQGDPYAAILWDLLEPSGEDAWRWRESPSRSAANIVKPPQPGWTPSGRDASLRNLRGVGIIVVQLDSDAEALVRKEEVRTDAELLLKRKGIRVLGVDEGGRTPGRPWLYLNVQVIKIDELASYVFSFQLKLFQSVSLERDSTFSTTAPTWEESTVGVVGRNSAASYVRESIGRMVDEFCNRYLAANQ